MSLVSGNLQDHGHDVCAVVAGHVGLPLANGITAHMTSQDGWGTALRPVIYKHDGVMNPSKMFSSARKLWIFVFLLTILPLDLCSADEVVEQCKEKGCNVEVSKLSNSPLGFYSMISRGSH